MSQGTAIVTGSAQGIGKAIALNLARNGFNVALNDLPSEKAKLDMVLNEVVLTGVQCRTYMADVSNEQEVKAMILAVVSAFGGIDVMVANAGVPYAQKLVDTPVESWDHTFAVNARGVFLCYKHAAIQMIAQGRGGRIIGASAIQGVQAVWPSATTYGASAAATRGLTQSAALELGAHNITVNAYAPTFVDTALGHQLVKDIDISIGMLPEQSKTSEIVSMYLFFLWSPLSFREIARCPLPQGIGQPNDVASVVAYLASKEARFITGQCVSINGGLVMT
ncbi:hypothetical protein EDD85DRAFT_130252 [Armillaria nabsnona]|nr:hypothetical protein EDD85DRAFT_130252 [Armillaria nabsnona]